MKVENFKLEKNKKTFAVLGDNHIGRTLQKYDMSIHTTNVLHQFTDMCAGMDVDFSVLLGDVFDKPTPKLEHQIQFIEWLQFHAANVAYTYILIGNHETHPYRFNYGHSALGIIEVMNIPNVKIVSRPLYEDGYLFLPFPSPAIYANQEEYDFDVQEQITSDHALLQSTDFCDEREVICAFTHLNIVGAKVNDTAWEYRGGEYCYNLPYKAIAGHIHKQQVCDNVFVLGAAGRLRFSEKDNPADMLVVVGDNLHLRPIDFPLMLEIEDATQETTEEVCAHLDAYLSDAHIDPSDYIVKVHCKESSVDWSAVKAHLLNVGVLHVMLTPIEVQKPKPSVIEVVKSKNEKDYMKEFLSKTVPSERIQGVLNTWDGIVGRGGIA